MCAHLDSRADLNAKIISKISRAAWGDRVAQQVPRIQGVALAGGDRDRIFFRTREIHVEVQARLGLQETRLRGLGLARAAIVTACGGDNKAERNSDPSTSQQHGGQANATGTDCRAMMTNDRICAGFRLHKCMKTRPAEAEEDKNCGDQYTYRRCDVALAKNMAFACV